MAPAQPAPAFDAQRFGRTPVPVIVGLAAGSLFALAVLIGVVWGAAVPALLGLVLAMLPVPLVLAGVLYLDRLEPEPPGLLGIVFGAGAAAAALSGAAGSLLGHRLISLPELGPEAGRLIGTTLGAAIAGAVVAETLKGAVLVALLRYRSPELDGASDGVVYATMTGLGFALIANLYAYVHAEHTGLGALASAFARRGILAPLWDPLFSSMIGVAVAYAAVHAGRRGWWAIAGGWAAAVALHALWASSVTGSTGRLAIVYLILLAVLAGVLAVVVADRRRIVRLITRYLPGYEGTGVVTPIDVAMLASLRSRRLARQWARLHRRGGGLAAMAEFQLAATELALACNRQNREQMSPAAFAARRDDSLAIMRAAIGHLTGPEPGLQPPWALSGPSVFTTPPTSAAPPGSRPVDSST
jgi:protease PrsW